MPQISASRAASPAARAGESSGAFAAAAATWTSGKCHLPRSSSSAAYCLLPPLVVVAVVVVGVLISVPLAFMLKRLMSSLKSRLLVCFLITSPLPTPSRPLTLHANCLRLANIRPSYMCVSLSLSLPLFLSLSPFVCVCVRHMRIRNFWRVIQPDGKWLIAWPSSPRQSHLSLTTTTTTTTGKQKELICTIKTGVYPALKKLI